MKVAIDAVGIRMGGAASLLADFLRWLPEVRPEWEWLVFLLPRDCRQFDDPPVPERVHIETPAIGDSGLGRLSWLYGELPRIIESSGADVLFAFANIASPRCPVPQVVYIQQRLAFQANAAGAGLGFRGARRRILRALILHGALRSTFAIVQTEDMRHRLESVAPELHQRVRVVPGCVSSSDRNQGIRVEKRHLIDSCPWPRFAYVAHPAEHKNHVTLIRALPRIIANYPKANVLLTIDPNGRNAKVDAGCIRKLWELVKELDLTDHVVWLGLLVQEEIRYLLRHITLAVFPSLEESFGLPLAEIITEGCPLAASDLPFARDVAGTAAAYFDPLDPESIGRCIANLMETPDQMNLLKHEALARRTRFEPCKVAEQIATILEAAANQRNGGGHVHVGQAGG